MFSLGLLICHAHAPVFEDLRGQIFLWVPAARMRGDGHKLKHRRLCLSLRNRSVTVRVTEVVGSPSLAMLGRCRDTLLGSWLWVTCISTRHL